MERYKQEINYEKVFAILPSIMGFPMVKRYSQWTCNRRMNGEIHPRHDKTVCRLVPNGIQVLEHGGDCITLFNWMIRYGGCHNTKEARMKLLSMAGSVIVDIPEYKENQIKYVPTIKHDQSIDNRIKYGDPLQTWMRSVVGKTRADYVMDLYGVGAALGKCKCEEGYKQIKTTVFWYIDEKLRILHDKVIAYRDDGHRDRDYGGYSFYGSGKGYRGKCLMGEHLLHDKSEYDSVYVVESEKTALLCRAFFEKGVWLASGGKNNLNKKMIKPGWILLPDIDAWDEWNEKFPGQCLKWWKKYPKWKPGRTDDIGDYVVWRSGKIREEYKKKEHGSEGS